MAVIRYKNPSDYAFLDWIGNFPASHHPLDTERFYIFVKTVGRFRSKKWRSYEYFQQRIWEHTPTFDKDEIERFWHRMQELLNFYQTVPKPTITDSFDKRSGLYQRGVSNNRRYEVPISQQEYYSRQGASAETLKKQHISTNKLFARTFQLPFWLTSSAKIVKGVTLRRGGEMAKYVDGFVLVVPKGKEDEYRKMAEMGRDSWMKHGALQYFECRGDDLKQQEMGDEKSRAFVEMAGATGDENVWFSFIVFNSKEHRDEVNKKVMEEMSESFKDQGDFEMPVEMTKMAYGGFEVAVEG